VSLLWAKACFDITLFKDFNNGDFVIMRLHDPLFVLVWMGKTQSDVIKDDQNENFKMMKV
jgi:hypothetical protein